MKTYSRVPTRASEREQIDLFDAAVSRGTSVDVSDSVLSDIVTCVSVTHTHNITNTDTEQTTSAQDCQGNNN